MAGHLPTVWHLGKDGSDVNSAAPPPPYDVLAIGRIGVDLYPLQRGVGLEDVATFQKFLGGSAANVSVAAARYGRRSALITRTGRDAFGRYVVAALQELGVDASFVAAVDGPPTPVTFCEIFPPDDFPLYFYRYPTAPDLLINPAELPLEAIRNARLFWVTVTGLSQEPSRAAHLSALATRGRRRHTILDLDWRPMFWTDRGEAKPHITAALDLVTVAVGNREECEVAVGETDPNRAADALLARGIELAIVKQGPKGVLAATQHDRVEVPGIPVEVVNGLGAGDAFGGALCHGLLEGWPVERIMRFANAAGAIVASQLECSTAMPTVGQVEAKLEAARGGRTTSSGAAGTTSRSVDMRAVNETRTRTPERVAQAWANRVHRPLLGADGRLLIVAADHPARGALGVRGDPRAMASRSALLDRLLAALAAPGVDGVLGTSDILEDLLLLGALDGKVVIGSMNRGGLQGGVFELDDRFTAYTTADIVSRGLDGGKMLTRIALGEPGTVSTLESCARAITDLAAAGVVAMVEPFMSVREDGRVRNLLDPDSTITSIHIAQGLGATSAYTWLKLPVVPELERVMDATTLPTLLLGGDPTGRPDETYAAWGQALGLPSVRGLVVGRALLYPPDDDVRAAVDIAAELVHGRTR